MATAIALLPSAATFDPAVASPDPTDGSYPGDQDELLSRLIAWFEESESTSYEARRLAERDRDYYDGIQWTPDELKVLRERKQPALVDNQIKPKIDTLRGMERRGRSDPKAFPRTPDQDQRADAATQALRYIADENRFDTKRSGVFENMLIEGFGGAEVVVKPDADGTGYDVVVNEIDWSRLFYDPHSRKSDFSDARYLGVVIWMDRAEADATYPEASAVFDAAFTPTGYADTYEDKPLWTVAWTDRKRRRLRVVQIHWREGRDWWTATYTRGGYVEPARLSPYEDRLGHRACPLILRSAYIDRNLNRYGVVRDMISLQDELNKRRSKALHLLSVRQVKMQQGAVDDVDDTRRELAKPDGLIVTNGERLFEILETNDLASGQMQLLEQTRLSLNAMGPNAAMTGKDPRELSGRAIIAQQAGGSMEQEPMADSLRQWTHKVYEAAWMRVRQFWKAEKWIRVTDDERNARFVGLNHHETLGERISALAPDLKAVAMQRMGLMPNDPRLDLPTGRIINDVDDMDVDITVEEGPDSPTLQSEQFQQLMQLAPAMAAQNQPIPLEVLIKASALRNKDQLIEDIEKSRAQMAQQQAQAAQAAAVTHAAQLQETQAKTANLQASAQDKQAQAVQRVHAIAHEHARAATTPVLPGIGPVEAPDNPMMPQNWPPPVQPQQGAPAQQ